MESPSDLVSRILFLVIVPYVRKCLRFANREKEVEMQEIATLPSHANSDTSPPLLVSNAQDVNPERPLVVSAGAEGATSVFPHHPVPC
jgi:hypothetical protein